MNKRAWRRNYSRRYPSKRYGYSFGPEIIVGFAAVLLFLYFLITHFRLGVEGALYALFGTLVFVGVVVLGVALYVSYKRSERERALELSQVDTMTGIAFENYLVGLLRFKGYTNIVVTPPQGDYGADLIAQFDSQKIAIQAKQYNTWKAVGVEAIYQVLGGEKKYDCQGTMVITTGKFTEQAYELSEKSKTVLIDRAILSEWITEYRKK